jgi:hypothetical protein
MDQPDVGYCLMSTFLTENEMNAVFVQKANYVDPIEVAVSGALPAIDGFHVVFADTSGGALSLSLPTTPPERYEPLIVNVGTNDLDITGTVNGDAGPHTIATQWFGIAIRNNDGALVAAVRSFVVAGPAPPLVEQTSFRSSTELSFGQFGSGNGDPSIAINATGTRAVIGARNENAAYVFDWNGTSWVETQRLTATGGDPGDVFGTDVAVDGDLIAVGAIGDDETAFNSGAVFVFELSGGSWSQVQKVKAATPITGSNFGYSIALEGNRLVVGSRLATNGANSSAGLAYVFDRGASFTETQILAPSVVEAGAYFGNSVALDGDRIVVGAPLEDTVSSNEGAVYVFDLSGTWTETQRLVPAVINFGAQFGWAVDLQGDRIVVGAPIDPGGGTQRGAVFVFDLSGTWTETQKLDGLVNGSFMGFRVVVYGNTLFTTAPFRDTISVVEQGTIYVWDLVGTWSNTSEVSVASPNAFMRLGESFAYAGGRALASDRDFDDSQIGTVYYFSQ